MHYRVAFLANEKLFWNVAELANHGIGLFAACQLLAFVGRELR